MTAQEIMKLADDYANTRVKLNEAKQISLRSERTLDACESVDESRAALQSAIESQAAEIERLKLHIKHIGNDALRKENHALQTRLDALEKQEPLALQEVEQLIAQHNYELHGDRARYLVRMTEKHHGIGGQP